MAQSENQTEEVANVQPVSASTGNEAPLGLATQNAEIRLSPNKFELPADKHSWARFSAGAWREISVTSDSPHEVADSTSRSVTTIVEKLQSHGGQQYSLEVQATVNLVGKQVVGPFVTRVLNWSTDQPGQTLETRRLDDHNLALALGSLKCEVWEIVYLQDERKLIDRIYYSPEQFPYVIRRETIAEASDPNEAAQLEVEGNVVALDVPYQVGQDIQQCTCFRTVRHSDKGNIVTVSLLSEAVPGGEVAVWTTEYGLQGAPTRWSNQVLVSYGLTPRVVKPLTRRELRRARRNR